MTESLDPRGDELALQVLATLAGASPDALRLLSGGLQLAEGPAGHFALPIFYLAHDHEQGIEPTWLTVGAMRVALKSSRRMLDSLESASLPFWAAVRDALEELQPAA